MCWMQPIAVNPARRALLDNSLTYCHTRFFNSREVFGEVRYQFHY